MKQRKLTPVQTRALLRRVTGFGDVVYQATQALAYATLGDRKYRLVYDNLLQFTGVAHRIA